MTHENRQSSPAILRPAELILSAFVTNIFSLGSSFIPSTGVDPKQKRQFPENFLFRNSYRKLRYRHVRPHGNGS